jgi:arabinose-5-phosphate isomerase
MEPSILYLAQQTIQLEANAVAGLVPLLTIDFEAAVKAVFHAKGRFIISGIGKSAIVAQKIVATLNSTGTPSLFMHAADAIHGDLGMIQQDDVVMLISKSGESPEIKVLLPLVKGFGNTVVAMVGNMESSLAKQADIVLDTSVTQEACPNNLAPTSSTTAQMVMGDALAVCLMKLNGFTGKDFAKYHPGGNLGKRMYLRVEDLYQQNEKPKVKPEASLKDTIMEISGKRLGVTAVVNDADELLGIITDGDLRRMLEKNTAISGITAADILTLKPKTITPNVMAVEALQVLRTNNISQLVVINENRYLGILHIHDLIREGIV